MKYEKIQEIYDKESRRYDEKRYLNLSGQYIDQMEREYIFKFLKGKSILDLGTGTGRFVIPLAKEGFDVTGIDISQSMLEIATKKMREANETVQLLQMNSEKLAFPDSTFDVVICGHAFKYMHPLRTLSESHRVLKRGGRIIIIFETSSHPLRKFLLLIKRCNFFAELLERLDSGFPISNFYSISEVTNMLERIGFKVIYKKPLFLLNFCVLMHIENRLFLKLIQKFDDKLPFGWVGIVVGTRIK
jgi:ubiquinone/menaquinone biosynthesis C-methylase UbiE